MILNEMRISSTYYLIIDLEATCCDDGSFPRHEMEIIEIGAVVMHAKTFEIASEFQSFVKPVRNPRLTPFCRQLTTITQQQVDAAPGYTQVLHSMLEWLRAYEDFRFCSWGNYDKSQFEQDCRFHQVPYPLGGHTNLKAEFAKALRLKKRCGLGAALKKQGLEFEGTAHRGIDDARNIARVVRRVCCGQ